MIYISDNIYGFEAYEKTQRPMIVYVKGSRKNFMFDACNSEKHAAKIILMTL